MNNQELDIYQQKVGLAVDMKKELNNCREHLFTLKSLLNTHNTQGTASITIHTHKDYNFIPMPFSVLHEAQQFVIAAYEKYIEELENKYYEFKIKVDNNE